MGVAPNCQKRLGAIRSFFQNFKIRDNISEKIFGFKRENVPAQGGRKLRHELGRVFRSGGWLFRVTLSDAAELGALMDEAAYKSYVDSL